MRIIFYLSLAIILSTGCQSRQSASSEVKNIENSSPDQYAGELDTATLAGGCFWCVEAAIEQIKGVKEVVSGYSGGTAANADYRKVASGQTRHAEAVQVYYDPEVISYKTLLEIFLTAHDPTQLNRQGPDVGPQYRSAIFYHNEDQKNTAGKVMEQLSSEYDKEIVTELNELDGFYKAEEYHQDYQRKNPYQPYIVSVSKPKVEKVKKKFNERIKESYK